MSTPSSSLPARPLGAAPPAQPAPTLWKHMLGFMVPMLASNVLQSMSGTVNNIYLGQMLGVQAMAAVSSVFPLLFLLIAVMIGLGSGAAVLIGQAWGARDYERVRAVAGTMLSVGLLMGVLVALFGGPLAGPLLHLLGTPADVLPEAASYARVMLFSAPLLFLLLLITSMLRGVGDAKTPLLTLVVSTAVGLLLTPALIAGWAGLPRLGVAASAWASLLSTGAALLWLVWRLHRQGHVLAPNAALQPHLRVRRALLGSILRVGLPTALTMITISISEVAVLFLVNGFGSQATAAYGAVNQIVSYAQFPAMSIAITCSIFGAQAIGAGRGHTLGHIARTGMVMNLLLTGSLVLLGYAFSRPVLGLFITDPAVVNIAQGLLHIMLWSCVVMGMSMVLSSLMRASGVVLVPTALSMLAIGGVQVPAAWLLSRQFGLDGVWMAYPVAFTAMLALQTTYYRLVWKKLPLRRL